ncbi:MAG: site-2 protease family protein, partial [Clostridia bacterium]|nr:site-2 protease family protein [Clostridia bacterium]
MVKQQTKIKVGASFFALAFFMLVTKNGIYFLYYVVAVVLHEFAHAKAAKKLGYKTKDICLSAFGAVLYGDFGDMSFADEAKIALAGPLLNLFMAVCTLALWWAFPSLYVFTQPFYMANVCIFAINLLPCYPLDGGRVLFAVMGQKLGENKAKKLFVALGVAMSFLCFCLFLCLLFLGVVNLTFGLFGLFLFANATGFKSQK